MSEEYGPNQLVQKLATGGRARIHLARHRGIEGFDRLSTFTNPDLGTRRERVEVRPHDLSKVTVRFD